MQKLSPADANDESLQRYKESLGLTGGKDLSDPNDKRVCIIHSLTMDSPGRGPVTIDLATPGAETTLKDKPFKIKEGAKFTMSATFKVQHEILSGLHYVQIVKRKGIKVSKDSEMIGSYAPNTDKQPYYTKKCKSIVVLSLGLGLEVTDETRYSQRGGGPRRHARPRPLQRHLVLR